MKAGWAGTAKAGTCPTWGLLLVGASSAAGSFEAIVMLIYEGESCLWRASCVNTGVVDCKARINLPFTQECWSQCID